MSEMHQNDESASIPDSTEAVRRIGIGSSGTCPLAVRWENVEDSWFWLDMRIGDDLLLTAGCPDPYPDMIEWVERCCDDWKPQTWYWDSEDECYLFTYIRISDFLRVESLKWGTAPVLAWSGKVTITDLHRAFYQGFMAFVQGDEFEPLLWCSYTVREWLDWFVGDRAGELVAGWLIEDSSRFAKDLEAILSCDSRWRSEQFPGIDDLKSSRIGWREYQTYPIQVKIPDGWDLAATEERRSILDALLARNLGVTVQPPPLLPKCRFCRILG